MKIGTKLVNALKTKYKSDFIQAQATLGVYINNPVGIGEHPQHLEEMDKLVATMAEAQDKLDILNNDITD
tara:strand:+ start:5044 stop:5253 length:210 start_codon:yes stop_codon:yes gene_type:complete